MKIALQLVSTAQNVSTKTTSAPENGTDFRSAFAAAAANVIARGSAPQIKTGKPETRDSKTQTSESKKKEAASEPPASAASVPAVAAAKDLVPQEAPKAPIALPVSGDRSSPTFDQRLEVAQTSHGTTSSATHTGAVTAAGGKLAGASSAVAESPAGAGPAESLRSAKSGGEEIATAQPVQPTQPAQPTQPVQPAQPAQPGQPTQPQSAAVQGAPAAAIAPASEAGTTKAAHAGDAPVVSKAADASDASEPAAGASAGDPSAVAAQQAAAAVVQSAAAPSLPTGLGSGVQFQPTSPLAGGKISNVNPGAESVKGTASRQSDSPGKAKAAPSDVRTKRADDASDDTRAGNGTAGTENAFAAKVYETPGSVNHSAGESKVAGNADGLQPITQAAQQIAADHAPASAQSAGVSAAPAGPAAAQAVPDNQAMQGVSSAQLVQSMHSSEMKLGMQSPEFGNISISTALNHQALSAQISIDHSELGRALAVHLPAIEEKLGSAYGVQAKVELRDTNNPSQSNESGYSNSGQQAKEQRQSQAGASAASGGGVFQRTAGPASIAPTFLTASTSRLDITI